jgi:UDP-N-acetylglucosamine transferase subunit ALG13
MDKKTTTSFNLDKAISRIAKPSVFDRIVKEIEAKEIPAKYIEQILVQYYDGNVVELRGNEITHPIPMNKNVSWDVMEDSFKKMRDVKIFINTDILEKDINEEVEKFLGTFC